MESQRGRHGGTGPVLSRLRSFQRDNNDNNSNQGDDAGHRHNNMGIHREEGGTPFLMHCLPAALFLSG